MRCLVCGNWTFSHICQTCQEELIVPQLEKRTLASGLEVFSFFAYDELAFLLHLKHHDIGQKVLQIVARKAARLFNTVFSCTEALTLLPIDDHMKHGYAHTAVVAKAFQHKAMKAQYNTLHAKNSVQYSGQTLAYRQQHPRAFEVRRSLNTPVVLVDDIVTTGSTLMEAEACLQSHKVDVAFAIVISDANR